MTTPLVRALRHLPRLHGVRDRLSVGRPVRAAHRGNARRHRAPPPRGAWATGCSGSCCSRSCRIPARLRSARAAARRSSGRSAALPRLLSTASRRGSATLIALAPARGRRARHPRADTPPPATQRLRVGLVTGCVQQVFFGDVNAGDRPRVSPPKAATVVAPASQGCCGALRAARRAGRRGPRIRARQLIAAVRSAADVDTIVVNAAGCGSTMKEYGELLRDDPDWAARAQRVRRARCATSPKRSTGLAAAAAARQPLHAARRVSRRLSPRARAGHPPRAARAARSRFPASRSCRSPRARSAAAAPASSTWSSRRWPPRSAAARPRTSRTPAPTSSSPRTPAASCRSAPPLGAGTAGHHAHVDASIHVVELRRSRGSQLAGSGHGASTVELDAPELQLGLTADRPTMAVAVPCVSPCPRSRSTTRPCATARRAKASPSRSPTSCGSPSGSTRSACTTSRAAGRAPIRKDIEFFEQAKHRTFRRARLAAFGSTRRKDVARRAATTRSGCSSTPRRRS